MEEAEVLADTVAIISKGKIVAIDSPAKLTEGHGEQLRLTLKSIDAAAVGLIRNLGFCPVPKDNDNLCVPVKTPDDVRRVLEGIERSGLALGGIDVRKPNLEEVFLKLTETPVAGTQDRAT
jgi:ABC-2 type transport system ATP-binding protein